MPKGNLLYKRGEIWWVELDPATGVETNLDARSLADSQSAGPHRKT